MKKVMIVAISVIVIMGLAVGGYCLYMTSTPEYALVATIKDMKTSGMTGLKEHLTDNAIEKVEKVEGWTDQAGQSGLTGFLSSLAQDRVVSFLKSKISETEWTVVDVMKGKSRAEAVIGFDYNGSIVGTIDIILIKEKGAWKIDGLSLPRFDNVSLW